MKDTFLWTTFLFRTVGRKFNRQPLLLQKQQNRVWHFIFPSSQMKPLTRTAWYSATFIFRVCSIYDTFAVQAAVRKWPTFTTISATSATHTHTPFFTTHSATALIYSLYIGKLFIYSRMFHFLKNHCLTWNKSYKIISILNVFCLYNNTFKYIISIFNRNHTRECTQ